MVFGLGLSAEPGETKTQHTSGVDSGAQATLAAGTAAKAASLAAREAQGSALVGIGLSIACFTKQA